MNPRRLLMIQAASLPLLGFAARGARASQGTAGGQDARWRPQPDDDATVGPGRVLRFPRDHGAHLAARIEWWYATGWLGPVVGSGSGAGFDTGAQQPSHGVQITFFRSRTGLGDGSASRFAPRQLLFAHAAVLDLRSGRHVHDQRIVRWSEAPAAAAGHASTESGLVRLRDWQIADTASAPPGRAEAPPGSWQAQAAAADFSLDLRLQRSQPVLLQGDAGFSRKGPDPGNASHYYSEPQLLATGQIGINGRSVQLSGRAWLDHEWSNELMHPQAVGWDWIGINLFDGSALTAFVLRRRDGRALWAGGSFRRPGGPTQAFDAEQVRWKAGRGWRSPGSGATYPVQWTVACPAGQFEVRALADAQELDSRASTGTIYWEGLSELLDGQGKRIGLGYLEMTGYAAPIKL